MLAMLAACAWTAAPATAATPAEAFVSENIDKGLRILNDKQLSEAQRKSQFADLLLSVIDMRRIATFTLGKYAATGSPSDQEAFAAAFQRYALAVYQSYFAKYAGQSLQVVRSSERAPGDFIVVTRLVDPGSGQQPLEVDFRVRTDTGKPIIVDFSVAGVWLVLEERDQFAGVLSKSNGNLNALVAHLDKVAGQYN
jgi:phospholipid transport system substrate-binding protein